MSSRAIKGLTILFFVLLIGIVAVFVLYTRTHKIERANQDFQNLVSSAEQLVQTFQTIDLGRRAQSSTSIFDALNQSSNADMAVINDSHGQPLLLWQRKAIPASGKAAPTGVPSYSLPQTTLQNVVFETSLPGAMRLVVAFEVIGVEDIQKFAYVIFAALAFWLIFLLLNLWLGSPPRVITADPSAGDDGETENENPDETPREAGDNPPAEPPQDSGKESDAPGPASDEGRAKPEERDSRFVLLDRKTGVTQERFLKFRLDKELERNAENALDLSLAIFRYEGLSEEDHTAAAGLLLGEFSHEDLIFEFGKDTFCVILPQHDLDQAIVRSELVMKKTEGLKDSAFAHPFEMTVGLTSRNGRLLDANRFLKEGQVALKKASREEGRIVGFRPDPVRFRSFLRHQRV